MRRFASYTLVEVLHDGVGSTLYRGTRDADGMPVVVKLPKNAYPDVRVVARFRNEYDIGRSVDTPGVVKVLAFEKAGDEVALVFESFSGESLHDLIQQQRLDHSTVLWIALGLTKTLRVMCERRILHKDIKPRNVLIDVAHRNVRLIDFGIAVRLDAGDACNSRPSSIEGTPAYMAPEQTGRTSRSVDERTDLYALGVTLYEALTGTLPFTMTDVIDLFYAHAARLPPPPRERAPEVPEALSAITMKLMAKDPADRYQSATGLESDLTECMRQLEETGTIVPFPLATRDHMRALRIPQRLYGREREVETLRATLERASSGRAELLLVSGYSGAGKSALVDEVRRGITQSRGHFIAGKFDQLNRVVPYSAMAAALESLIHQLLLKPSEVLAEFRRAILTAVRANGKVLTDVVPEFELIVGPQPLVPELSPAASAERFTQTFLALLAALASPEHPLAIFVDDLQWADLASLMLIESLLSAPDSKSFLFIGAYRSNEVDAVHPLRRLISVVGSRTTVNEVPVRQLNQAETAAFVADALSTSMEETEPLARVVFEKTEGNPFFLTQFLKALDADGQIVCDPETGRWTWDLTAIRERFPTDNVVAFVSSRIQRLPPEVIEILKAASCVGFRFDAQTLALVEAAPVAQIESSLSVAVDAGVVLALDDGSPIGAGAGLDTDPASVGSASYRFVHDRVQQAAYSLIPPEKLPAMHVRLGRLLLTQYQGRPIDDVFEIVNNLNLGADLIMSRDELSELVRLNFEAGLRAKRATAYKAAFDYFTAAIERADEATWTSGYDFAFRLHLESAECAALVGAHDKAGAIHASMLCHARTDVDRMRVRTMRMRLDIKLGRSGAALAEAIEGLKLANIHVVDTPAAWEAAFNAELARVRGRIAERDMDSLIHAPPMVDPLQIAAVELMFYLSISAIGDWGSVGGWSLVKQASLIIEHGNTPLSPVVFLNYAASMTMYTPNESESYRFAKLALALQESSEDQHQAAYIYFGYASVAHYAVPWRESLAYLERAQLTGMESGNFLFASYACSHTVIARLALGEPLSALAEEVDRYRVLIERTQVATSKAILLTVHQAIQNLQGTTRDAATLSTDTFDEEAHLEAMERGKQVVAICWYLTIRGALKLMHGDPEGALPMLSRAMGIVCINFTPDIRYFTALTILALAPSATAEAREHRAPLLARCLDDLERWASCCEANYGHRLLLVRAEAARVAGDALGAMDLYDKAINEAKAHEWVRDVALANERAAMHYIALGRTRLARSYIFEAYHYYLRWGASAKVNALVKQFPEALRDVERTAGYTGSALPTSTLTVTTTTRERVDQLDVIALIRAARAIAGEIVLDRLLVRLMQVVAENAGAERATLALVGDRGLHVAATIDGDSEPIIPATFVAVDDAADVCPVIIHYVARTQKGVVLSDASREGAFTKDPSVQARRPRSVLCVPLVQRAALRAVLYLENNLTTDAFTPERVDLLNVLSGQMAISIEHAALYNNLEQKVAERTRELREAQSRLVKLEKHAVEVQMAGGFAHEMRNALASAKIYIGGAYAANGKSLCVANADALASAFADVKDGLPQDSTQKLIPVLRRVKSNEERLDGILERVARAIERALQVTSTILDYSQLNRELPRFDVVGVREVVESVVAEFGAQLAEHAVEVSIEIAPERVIRSSASHLAIVVRNLIANARDALVKVEEGNPKRLCIRDEQGPGRWTLHIVDTGSGIEPDAHAQIFHPFFSTQPSTHVGLGLSMVDKLVSLYEGLITFESTPGAGTSFSVTFPTPPLSAALGSGVV